MMRTQIKQLVMSILFKKKMFKRNKQNHKNDLNKIKYRRKKKQHQ